MKTTITIIDPAPRRFRPAGLLRWVVAGGIIFGALGRPLVGWSETYRVTGVGIYPVPEFATLHAGKQSALLAAKHSALEQLTTVLRARPESDREGAREEDLRAVVLGIGEFDHPSTEITTERADVVIRTEAAVQVDPVKLKAGLTRLAERADLRAVVLRAWQERVEAERSLRKAEEELRRMTTSGDGQAALLLQQRMMARASALEVIARVWLAGDRAPARGSRFADVAMARQGVELALQLDPSCGLAHLTRGYVRLEEKNARAASIDFAAALRSRPDDGLAHLGLAYVSMQLGQRDRAIESLRAGLRQQRDDLQARLALATLLREKGDLSSAEVEYRALLTRAPAVAEAHAGLGHVSAKKGDLQGAIDTFRNAVRLSPEDGAVRFALGVALGRQGQLEEAIAEQRHAVRLNPQDAEYRHHLGYLLSLKGQTDEALAEYEAGLHLAPQDVPLHLKVGELLQKKGDSDGARRAYLRAAMLRPSESAAHWGLAEALAASGQSKDAAREYRQFLKLTEDTPTTRAKIQQAQARVAQLESR